jgi:predicted metalloprotease
MKWQGGRKSDNFEDRRGMSGGQKLTLGGIGGVIVLIIGFLMGGARCNCCNRRKI